MLPEPTSSIKSEAKLQNNHAPGIIGGTHGIFIRYYFNLELTLFLLRTYHNPIRVFKLLKALKKMQQQFIGNRKIAKYVKVDGKFYSEQHAPGFPSLALANYRRGLLNRIIHDDPDRLDLNTILIAITRSCPFNCDHCFEKEAMDGKDVLSLDELKNIIKIFQDYNIPQIQISGGEPMARLDDLTKLLRSARAGTDFLLLTTGYNLTIKNARKLKESGLTGVMITLDHFDPLHNNLIKKHPEAFGWAMNAIDNAHRAKLLVGLSLCCTRNFLSKDNLMKYMELAKSKGVAFVHILEPRKMPHMGKTEFELSAEQKALLNDFYINMNFSRENKDMPIVTYLGYHQSLSGCAGAGDRYLYVDTEGYVHACPFCRKKSGNVLSAPIKDLVANLNVKGCHKYKSFVPLH